MPREPQWTLKELADHVGEDVNELAGYFKAAGIAKKPVDLTPSHAGIFHTKASSAWNKTRYNRRDLLRWYNKHKETKHAQQVQPQKS